MTWWQAIREPPFDEVWPDEVVCNGMWMELSMCRGRVARLAPAMVKLMAPSCLNLRDTRPADISSPSPNPVFFSSSEADTLSSYPELMVWTMKCLHMRGPLGGNCAADTLKTSGLLALDNACIRGVRGLPNHCLNDSDKPRCIHTSLLTFC